MRVVAVCMGFDQLNSDEYSHTLTNTHVPFDVDIWAGDPIPSVKISKHENSKPKEFEHHFV